MRWWLPGEQGVEKALCVLRVGTETVDRGCAAKFSDQVRKGLAAEETASSSGMKKSRVTGSCLSQNIQDIWALRRTEWSAGGRPFHAASIRPILWRILFISLWTVSLKCSFSPSKLLFTSMGRWIDQCTLMGNWKPTCCSWAHLGFSETERFLCHFQ